MDDKKLSDACEGLADEAGRAGLHCGASMLYFVAAALQPGAPGGLADRLRDEMERVVCSTAPGGRREDECVEAIRRLLAEEWRRLYDIQRARADRLDAELARVRAERMVAIKLYASALSRAWGRRISAREAEENVRDAVDLDSPDEPDETELMPEDDAIPPRVAALPPRPAGTPRGPDDPEIAAKLDEITDPVLRSVARNDLEQRARGNTD